MKFKHRLQAALRFFAFAFYPRTTLIVCSVLTVVVLLILRIAMSAVDADSLLYDLLFALTTGAVASFIVSIVVELSGNYKNNKLAWHELQDYYAAITDYEITKQVHMQQTSAQRAEKRALNEWIAEEGSIEEEEEELPKDIVQSTWKQLPTLIPILKRTFEEKKGFLSEKEIMELNSILLDYRQIRSEVHLKLMMSPLLHNALNHPDEDFLEGLYPKNILEDIPAWMRMHLAEEECRQAMERLTDSILADGFLMEQYMKGYDISERALEEGDSSYEEASLTADSKAGNTGVHDAEDVEDYDCSEPEDEESFRALHDEMKRIMEEEHRPFASRLLSQCCYHIAESMDALEQCVLKKPYYGIQLKIQRKDAEKEMFRDPISEQVYLAEKKRLRRHLENQKTK